MTYQVPGWNNFFENNKSRERDQCSFVCVPNKQDGMGFTRIMAEKDGATIYGIWNLILGALSRQKKPREGYLTEDGQPTGTAWTADDLALRWRRPVAEIRRALDFLSSDKIGWMTSVESTGTQGITESARPVPAECLSGALEEKRIEGKEVNPPNPLSGELDGFPENLKTAAFMEAWAEWKQHRREKKKPLTATSVKKQLKSLSLVGVERAVAIIDYTIQKGWQGLADDTAVPLAAGIPIKGARPNGNGTGTIGDRQLLARRAEKADVCRAEGIDLPILKI